MAIRSDKDSSSAAPNSGMESVDLEKYGVWVKAEPRDILEGSGLPSTDDLELDLPAEASPVAEESFLSEDEERLLGSFDAEFGSNSLSDASSSDLGPLPDIEDVSSDDGFGLSLEDLSPPSPSGGIRPDTEIDMETVKGLDDGAEPSPPTSESVDGMEDVSAEFLDDIGSASSPTPPSVPASSDFSVDDVTAQFLDASDEAIPLSQPIDGSQDFESLDIDLRFDGDSDRESGRAASEFDDFISPSDSKPQRDAFDDVAAVTARLSEPVENVASGKSGSSDLSSELLAKIADELRNIRGELVSLKTQIAGISVPSESSPKTEPQTGREDASGFFNKEEDETIALTGDELDNILNTADFTEESAEVPAESLLEESLLPESGVYASDRQASPAIEEIKLGESVKVDEVEEPVSDDSFLELASVAEEGVRSMTSAPEDSSYLDENDLQLAEDLSVESAPLQDVPLVEPDLSEFEIETDDSQSGLEISDELPLASDQPDMTLNIEAGPEYKLENQADEAEFLEPVPELDESGFGEISLHEESTFKPTETATDETVEDEIEELEVLTEVPISEPASVLPDEVPVSLDENIAIEPKTPPVDDSVPSPARDHADSSEDDRLKSEIRTVLSYLDKLLDSLPEEKIEEFAKSEYFDTYKRLFEELGLV